MCTENKVCQCRVFAPRSGAGICEIDVEVDGINIGESLQIGGHVYKILNNSDTSERMRKPPPTQVGYFMYLSLNCRL